MKNYYRNQYEATDATKMFLYVILLPYLAVFVLYAVYSVVANILGMEIDEFSETLPVLMINAVFMQLCFVVIFFVFNKRRKINFIIASKLNVKLNPWIVAIGICMGFAMLWLSNPAMDLYERGLSALGCNVRSDLGFELNTAGNIIFAILCMGILPAFIEEAVFRGLILQGLRKYGNWFAIIASALLFMLVHGNIQQTIYQFAFGILAGYLVIKTGSLWISIIIHAVNNTIVVVLNSIQSCAGIVSTPVKLDVFYILQAVLYLVLLALVIYGGIKLINKIQSNKTCSTNSEVTQSSDAVSANFETAYSATNADADINAQVQKQETAKSEVNNSELLYANMSFKEGCKNFKNDKQVFKDGMLGVVIAIVIGIFNSASMFM